MLNFNFRYVPSTEFAGTEKTQYGGNFGFNEMITAHNGNATHNPNSHSHFH